MIAILSDFGHSEYLGMLKGVIISRCPEARIVDLTSSVSPQNIIEGAWILLESFRYFPAGTTFLCIVDPGVGSDRKIVAVRSENYFFVGPDNGLVYPAASADNILEVAEIPVAGRGASAGAVGSTFHGRDVMAPAAAAIDLSRKISSFNRLAGIQALDLISCSNHGMIVKVDRFGNLVTNIPCTAQPAACVVASNGDAATLPFFTTYGAAQPATPFLIKGSSGMFEISVKADQAAKFFPKFRPGAPVSVTPVDRC